MVSSKKKIKTTIALLRAVRMPEKSTLLFLSLLFLLLFHRAYFSIKASTTYLARRLHTPTESESFFFSCSFQEEGNKKIGGGEAAVVRPSSPQRDRQGKRGGGGGGGIVPTPTGHSHSPTHSTDSLCVCAAFWSLCCVWVSMQGGGERVSTEPWITWTS